MVINSGSGNENFGLRGFTLIEMMVVIAIFFIITGVLLVNVPDFRDKTSVDLVAQDIAVTIRTAQVFGVGNKAVNDQIVPYGVNFTVGQGNGFILFADLPDEGGNSNHKYDPSQGCGGVNECQTAYLLNGFSVDSIKGYNNDEVTEINKINILFTKPRLSPYFCAETDGVCDSLPNVSRVEIVIKANRGSKYKKVVVYANGQIAVEKYDPPVGTN